MKLFAGWYLFMYIYIYVYMYIYICIYMYIYVCIYIYVYILSIHVYPFTARDYSSWYYLVAKV